MSIDHYTPDILELRNPEAETTPLDDFYDQLSMLILLGAELFTDETVSPEKKRAISAILMAATAGQKNLRRTSV